MKKNRNVQKGFKIAGNILTILIVIFIVRALISFDIDYSVYLNTQSILFILCFLVITTILVFVVGYNWKILLEYTSNKKLPLSEIFSVYTKSNLGKYLPGNVMQFAGRNLLGTKLGITQTSIAMSSVCEIGMLIVTCAIWSLILGGDTFLSIFSEYIENFGVKNILLILAILIVLAVLFLILIFKKFKSFFEEIRSLFTGRFFPMFFKSFFLLTIHFIASGMILGFILSFSSSQSLNNLPLIITAYIISWLIGFLIPGVPGGMGVRETLLTLMLSGTIDEGIVLSAAVLQRFILVIADILAYLFFLFIKNQKTLKFKE